MFICVCVCLYVFLCVYMCLCDVFLGGVGDLFVYLFFLLIGSW